MMKNPVSIFFSLLLLGIVTFGAAVGHAGMGDAVPNMVVKIHFEDRNLAYVQLRPLRLTYEDVESKWARALVTLEQLENIQALGYEVEVMYEDARIRAAERRAAMGSRWTGYNSAVASMQTITAANPGICRMYNIGQTVQSRDIWVMKITDNPDTDETDEAEVRMAGNIHGDEYMSFEIMLLLIEYLTDNYGTDPDVTNLVNNREIWIQPSINPDGHENGSRYNANGVDMNRNHGYMWNYSGATPFSEPELQHFRAYSLERNFSMSLSFHGETTYFNYPWNFTGENAFDKTYFHALGNVYTSLPVGNPNNYTNTEGWDWYQTNGDTNDWSYGCRGDFDVTIETPGYSESSIQTDWNDNRDAILYIIDQAAYGISGVVADAYTSDPLEALVTIHEHPIMVYTDPVAGDYHRPLQAGTYDMTVWANGYAPMTITDVMVASESTSTMDVMLIPNYAYYVMHVCWNILDDYYESNSTSWGMMWPHEALGPPDGVPGSLGKGCEVAYDMGEDFVILDNPGNDLTVFEADVGDGDEGFTLYGSSAGFLGPWVMIGTGTGTTEFDLSSTSLSEVRYLRIVDDDNGSSSGTYPGFDLDAIGAIQRPEGCGIIRFDENTYTCDNQVVTVTVIDEDLNGDSGSVETVDVPIWSDSDMTGELVTLTEESMDSNVFEGTILLSETNGGPGFLLVDRGDTIEAQYDDADCQGSPQTVMAAATANCADPILIFDSLTINDASGDSDGVLDPGESVVFEIILANIGDEGATNVTAVLSSNHPEYITITDDTAIFYDIPMGGTSASVTPHFTLSSSGSTPDPQDIVFTLTISSDDSYGDSTFDVEVTSSTFIRRYFWSMDTDPGWTETSQWAWGSPTGNGGDPSSGYTGDNVYGYNLSGTYTNDMPETNLTTTVINCSGLESVELRFKRWLGVESASYDHAYVRISNNGSSWSTIWSHTGGTMEETSWADQVFDISSYADGESSVYLRWVMGETDGSVVKAGWNIDDVEIWAESSEPVPTSTPNPTPTPPPTPTMTPPPTPTMTPEPTATPEPSETPVQTFTPEPTFTQDPTVPTATPTPVTGELSFDLTLNQEMFRPWDHFLLTTRITNGDEPVILSEFIILDVYGMYWFWPEWQNSVAFETLNLAALAELDQTILDFWWPSNTGHAEDLRFWGALLDPDTSQLACGYDMVTFGYTE